MHTPARMAKIHWKKTGICQDAEKLSEMTSDIVGKATHTLIIHLSEIKVGPITKLLIKKIRVKDLSKQHLRKKNCKKHVTFLNQAT
jgi:hypothetical protein